MKNLTLIFLLFLSHLAWSQLDEEEYRSEFSWGINKNTNSGLIGGFVFKVSRFHSENTYSVYGLEFMNVKHPNEVKLPSITASQFIWAKENYLYSIRALYGREVIRFRKAPQQGVQVSTVIAGGPSLALVAPYYLLYNREYKPYAEVKNNLVPASIEGAGGMFYGLGESDLVPGLNAKLGVIFEFGTFRENATGMEIGVSLEAFPKKIIIIPSQANKAVYTALYINLFWGSRR